MLVSRLALCRGSLAYTSSTSKLAPLSHANISPVFISEHNTETNFDNLGIFFALPHGRGWGILFACLHSPNYHTYLSCRPAPLNLTYGGPMDLFQYTILSYRLCSDNNTGQ
jgi:hypothetical protein